MSEQEAPVVKDWANVPESAEAITEDDKIKKIVLTEGDGEQPPKHARCLVHYTGRLAESGDVFMDTRQESATREPQKLIASRDSVTREAGLNLAVATMKTGETSRFYLHPDYGYGNRGSFSFPTVPPAAHLVYDIQLLSFEPPNEADAENLRDLTYEERLEAAERKRLQGNDTFRAGNHHKALEIYTTALSYIDEDLLMQLEGFHYDKAMECRTPVLLNMAAAYRQIGDMDGAIGMCSQVLAVEPTNAKALFRRGSARLSLGQTDAAISDLEAARKAAPTDSAIVKELANARQMLKEQQRAQKEVFSGVLGKTGGTLYPDKEIVEEEEEIEDLPEWNEAAVNESRWVSLRALWQAFWRHFVKLFLWFLRVMGQKAHAA